MKKPIAVALIAIWCWANPAVASEPAYGGPFGTCRSTVASDIPANTVNALLARKDLTKSEFETNDEYEHRIGSTIAAIGPVRFVLSFTADEGKSDAEAQTFTIRNDAIAAHLWHLNDQFVMPGDNSWFGLPVGGKATPIKRYVATNIYGRKSTVKKFDRTRLAFVFEGGPQFRNTVAPYVLSIPRKDAIGSTRTIKIVIEGDVSAPFITSDFSIHAPTIYDKLDTTTTLIAIHFTPRCGSLIDKPTGAVLATFDPARLSTAYGFGP